MERVEESFPSGTDRCAAWLYRPTGANGDVPCVVMAHGFSLTRHDGLAPYAEALAAAGAAVVAFDFRHFGDSGGLPRQRFRLRSQLEDWVAAIDFARGLPGIDEGRIVLWGFSFAGGEAVMKATRDRGIAAIIALCPFADGLARVLATPPSTSAWILPRAARDLMGRHTLIDVTGPPGSRAAMTLPGESEGFAAAVTEGSPWRNAISPGIFMSVGAFRPVARAARVTCPAWIGLGERDVSVSKAAVETLAERAPNGELHRYDVDHFEPFTGDRPARIAADQVTFLRRNGLLTA